MGRSKNEKAEPKDKRNIVATAKALLSYRTGSCDLDLDPMTLIHSVPKMKFLGRGFQNLEPQQDRHRQTDRQTDRRNRTYYQRHLRVLIKIETKVKQTPRKDDSTTETPPGGAHRQPSVTQPVSIAQLHNTKPRIQLLS